MAPSYFFCLRLLLFLDLVSFSTRISDDKDAHILENGYRWYRPLYFFQNSAAATSYIQTKYIEKKILTFLVNWCTITDWYVEVVASTTALMRICMYVFLERDRREKRWQIFAQFGGSTCCRLVVGNKKKRTRKEHLFCCHHSLVEWQREKKSRKKYTDADVMLFYIHLSLLFLLLLLLFCVHEYSKTTTRIFYQ